jgi:hypothetical protein
LLEFAVGGAVGEIAEEVAILGRPAGDEVAADFDERVERLAANLVGEFELLLPGIRRRLDFLEKELRENSLAFVVGRLGLVAFVGGGHERREERAGVIDDGNTAVVRLDAFTENSGQENASAHEDGHQDEGNDERLALHLRAILASEDDKDLRHGRAPSLERPPLPGRRCG